MKHRQWEEERKEKEAAKLALEKERMELILKKRDQERKDLDYRLQESREKLTLAQTNLEKVLLVEKNISYAKVELSFCFKHISSYNTIRHLTFKGLRLKII
jgi:hypothetical protein